MRYVFAILILCAAIIFHELGHFLLAKACHIKVNEFAFGMGPKILSFKRGETVYAWRLFPIGGMCSMQGEDDEDMTEGSFQSAKVWQRILVVAAGPVFNFILAFIAALIVIFSVGADPCTVSSVSEGSPAAEAGLMEGDLIVGYEGSGVSNARELYMYTMMDGMPEDEINLTVVRNGEKKDISFAPDVTKKYVLGFNYSAENSELIVTGIVSGSSFDKAGIEAGDKITGINGTEISSVTDFNNYLSEHPLGEEAVEIEYQRDGITYTANCTPTVSESLNGGFSYSMQRVKQGFFSSIGYAFGEIKYWINTTIKSIGSLFTGRFGVQDLSGPVGVVSTIGNVYEEASQSGGAGAAAISLLNMLILLSANLGVMNLLPLPALDGGRLVFLFVECIRRKRCSQAVEGMVHFIGIIAFLGLAVYIAFNDVFKLL